MVYIANIEIALYIAIKLLLLLLAAIFLWVVREEDFRKSHKSPFVVVLNITMCSLDVNISVVRTTASDKGQERRQVW